MYALLKNGDVIMPVFRSHRNQSIDLLCKLIDWFLYEGNIGTYWCHLGIIPEEHAAARISSEHADLSVTSIRLFCTILT